MPLVTPDMNLEESWEKVLQQVQTASENPGHAFRFVDLATTNPDGMPAQRTVVLRDFDGKQTFTIFTDARSRKVKHIHRNNQVSLLFYDADRNLQLSLQGEASLITKGAERERYWEEAGSRNPHSYTSIKTPGQAIDIPEDAYQWNLENHEHFCVIHVKARRMIFLQLDGKRHRRGVLEFEEDQVNSYWIAP